MDMNLKNSYTQECLYTDYRSFLRDAADGEVVTRYQTVPRRHITIGEAKPVCMNYHYANMFNGQMVLRIDDLGNNVEQDASEAAILHDMVLLGVKPHRITYTSDYVLVIIKRIQELLETGFAFCDPTDPTIIEEDIKQRMCSAYRFVCPEQNMKIFSGMLEGKNRNYVVRARLDYVSANHLMRDPIICMAKDFVNPRTNERFNVCPTATIAVPVMDGLEGVTHIFTPKQEFDYPVQYKWFVHKFQLRKVVVRDYFELYMENTPTRDETMRYLISNRHVDGWSDLRLPTVKALMQRGVLLSTMTEFMLEQSVSRKSGPVAWRNLWSINKKNLLKMAYRFTAIKRSDAAIGTIENFELETQTQDAVNLIPKNDEAGQKPLYRTPQILLDKYELEGLNVGDTVFLVRWGNFKITALRDDKGSEHLRLLYIPDDQDIKNKPKLLWLALDPSKLVKVNLITLGTLFNHKHADEGDNWKEDINNKSRIADEYYSEGFLRTIEDGATVHFEKAGFAKLRRDPRKNSVNIIHDFINIPDGKRKSTKA